MTRLLAARLLSRRRLGYHAPRLRSLDLSQMKDPCKRPDKDYAVSWVRDYGKGRVFYCTLGRAAATYWDPAVLRHCLAGIQFVIGDLKADASPRAGAR
jgi:hypothetical protein